MAGRLACLLGCLLFAGVACGTRPPAVASIGTPSLSQMATSSRALDSFAAQIAEQIDKKRLKSVVVIGAVGLDATKLTQDGQEIGDEISATLTKKAKGFQVVDRAELRAFVKRNGVSEAMIVSDVLANWIARKTGISGYVVIRFGASANGRYPVTASLYKKGQDDGDLQSTTKTEMEFGINQKQEGFRPLDSGWNKTTYTPEELRQLPANRLPVCISCLLPAFTEAARHSGPGINETVVLAVTIFPNGKTGDIAILKPARYGLNASTVETVLYAWRYKPGSDSEGKPTAIRLEVETRYYVK